MSSFYPVCFGKYMGQADFTPPPHHILLKQTEIAKTSTRNPVEIVIKTQIQVNRY